jgi:hypothetical protein
MFDDFLVGLLESGLCYYTQPSRVVEQFVNTLVCNFRSPRKYSKSPTKEHHTPRRRSSTFVFRYRPVGIVTKPGTQSVSQRGVFQYGLHHHEKHEDSSLGKRCARNRVPVLQLLQPPEFWPAEQRCVGRTILGRSPTMEQPPTGVLGSALGGDASARMVQLKVQLQS